MRSTTLFSSAGLAPRARDEGGGARDEAALSGRSRPSLPQARARLGYQSRGRQSQAASGQPPEGAARCAAEGRRGGGAEGRRTSALLPLDFLRKAPGLPPFLALPPVLLSFAMFLAMSASVSSTPSAAASSASSSAAAAAAAGAADGRSAGARHCSFWPGTSMGHDQRRADAHERHSGAAAWRHSGTAARRRGGRRAPCLVFWNFLLSENERGFFC